jgi:hypothetical protein
MFASLFPETKKTYKGLFILAISFAALQQAVVVLDVLRFDYFLR